MFNFTYESKDTQYVCNTYAFDKVRQKFFFEIVVKTFFDCIQYEFNNKFVFVKKRIMQW